MVQAALANVKGVNGLQVVTNRGPKQNSSGSRTVSIKDQLVQYTGNAKVEDVIAILHQKTSLSAKVGKRVTTESKGGKEK